MSRPWSAQVDEQGHVCFHPGCRSHWHTIWVASIRWPGGHAQGVGRCMESAVTQALTTVRRLKGDRGVKAAERAFARFTARVIAAYQLGPDTPETGAS